ncbi:MAG: peptidoglycan DD-metalloendopeptidase family protein [Calditrichaeota bacterium]|nr:peptidoglycan DD-metalloendopeptidase family protein [Calditrichota bacterium]
MRDKKIKLIFFSLRDSKVKDYALDGKKLLFISLLAIVFLVLAVGAGIKYFTGWLDDTKVESLEQANASLMKQLGKIRDNIQEVKHQIRVWEQRDDEMRLMAGLDTLSQDVRMAGVGGPEIAYSEEFDLLPHPIKNEVVETSELIDQLKRQLQLLTESRKAIDEALKNRSDEISHIPTIKPVRRGRLTARFGYRIDPFTGARAKHMGIDLGAPEGTPIFAPADGVVIKVVKTYKPHKSYGRYVVIDHGNGYRTVYGHMHSVKVRMGQKVKRWDVIGTVGQTGRATGPHLHYEVIAYGKKMNPLNYIYE